MTKETTANEIARDHSEDDSPKKKTQRKSVKAFQLFCDSAQKALDEDDWAQAWHVTSLMREGALAQLLANASTPYPILKRYLSITTALAECPFATTSGDVDVVGVKVLGDILEVLRWVEQNAPARSLRVLGFARDMGEHWCSAYIQKGWADKFERIFDVQVILQLLEFRIGHPDQRSIAEEMLRQMVADIWQERPVALPLQPNAAHVVLFEACGLAYAATRVPGFPVTVESLHELRSRSASLSQLINAVTTEEHAIQQDNAFLTGTNALNSAMRNCRFLERFSERNWSGPVIILRDDRLANLELGIESKLFGAREAFRIPKAAVRRNTRTDSEPFGVVVGDRADRYSATVRSEIGYCLAFGKDPTYFAETANDVHRLKGMEINRLTVVAHGCVPKNGQYDRPAILLGAEYVCLDELNAREVVLNTCSLAATFKRSDGAFDSLPREFIRNGAQMVIASVCPVPDFWASGLMFSIHQYEVKGLSLDVAFEQARTSLLRGDWSPETLAYLDQMSEKFISHHANRMTKLFMRYLSKCRDPVLASGRMPPADFVEWYSAADKYRLPILLDHHRPTDIVSFVHRFFAVTAEEIWARIRAQRKLPPVSKHLVANGYRIWI